MPGQGLGKREKGAALVEIWPWSQGTLAERALSISQQQGGIGTELAAKALAGGAPAHGAVEGKVVRVERLEAAATAIAGQVLAETLDLPLRFGTLVIDESNMDDPASQLQGGLHAVC